MSDNDWPRDDHRAAWRDLRERLLYARHSITTLAVDAGYRDKARLRGKVQGVELALSYMDEWERTGITLETLRGEQR